KAEVLRFTTTFVVKRSISAFCLLPSDLRFPVSSDLFRLSESELDVLLDAARPDLERRGISVADGSAREALVWAFSFSTEREIGIERQRIAATLTLRGDAPLMMQSIATGSRVQYRNQT